MTRKDKTRPGRIPPAEALPEVLERIVLRRQVIAERGDVVITRERMALLSPGATMVEPWQYRVRVHPDGPPLTFRSFQYAASEAERLASDQNARVLYVEDSAPTLLADYRRHPPESGEAH